MKNICQRINEVSIQSGKAVIDGHVRTWHAIVYTFFTVEERDILDGMVAWTDDGLKWGGCGSAWRSAPRWAIDLFVKEVVW